MEFRQRGTPAVVALAVAAVTAGLARHAEFIRVFAQYQTLMVIWTGAFAFQAAQWLLSLRDRPAETDAEQAIGLLGLVVVVNVPVYNEDPAALDRCLYALSCQTRLPDRVEIVDDGSDAVDYSRLKAHWHGWHNGIEYRWIDAPHGGKKHAQAATFRGPDPADIFVTVDSDTALEHRAIEEGLKPFADQQVMSVAGIELAVNAGVNWLTRTVSARSLYFQIVACGAQSVLGDILVNRGAFALYRAAMIRDFTDAYLNETFLGKHVDLGDDAALTLFAQVRGKAVQQSSAFALTMYPEQLSHHFRQWVRWMRGSTIRNTWRLRYLPVWSYGWWFTAIGLFTFLTSTLAPLAVAGTWPQSEDLAVSAVLAMVAWAYLTVLRVFCVIRSDESFWFRLGTVAAFPAAMLWAAFVLRPIRYWGILTCLRQRWTTRQDVEVAVAAGNSR